MKQRFRDSFIAALVVSILGSRAGYAHRPSILFLSRRNAAVGRRHRRDQGKDPLPILRRRPRLEGPAFLTANSRTCSSEFGRAAFIDLISLLFLTRLYGV